MSHVTPEVCGQLTVTAENTFGSVEKSLALSLATVAPEFINPIEDVTANLGDSAIFNATYQGYPTPEVTWLINGEKVPKLGRAQVTTVEQEHSVHVTELEIEEVTVDDVSTEVTCVLTNEAGSTDCSAELTIEGVYS